MDLDSAMDPALLLAIWMPLAATPPSVDGLHPSLEAPTQLVADGAVIDAGAFVGYAAPLWADVVGDDRPDLLVGNYRGKFAVYENVGEPNAPRFEGRDLLRAGTAADGEEIEVHNW